MGQAFDVGEQIQAQLRQNLLPDALQRHGLEIGAHHTDHQHSGVHSHHPVKLGQFEFSLDDALNFAHQQRRCHVVDNGNHHHHKHQRELLPEGLGVAQESADNLPVGHVPLSGFPLSPPQNAIGHEERKGEGPDNGRHNENRQIFSHYAPLLPPPVAAAPPFSGRRGRFPSAPRDFPPPPDDPRPGTESCPSPRWWRSGGQ